MKSCPRLRTFAASLLAAALLPATLPAQQTKPQQPATPARTGAPRAKPEAQPRAKPEAQQRAEAADATEVTLDELFAADSYAVYGELRMVGQHFASEEFRQMLEPLRLTGVAPADLVEMYDFVAAHAEQLAGARVAFTGMPVKSGLPTAVAAFEMPSGEEARKFAPRLREFLAKSSLFGGGGQAATVETASTTDGADAGRRGGRRRGRARGSASAGNAAATRKAAAVKEAALPFHIKQAGAVVALADAPFTFKKLRGAADAPPLARDPGFAAARARLSTETVFLYFNTTRMSAATRRQMEEQEREHQRIIEEERARAERERNDASTSTNAASRATANRNSGAKVVSEVDPETGNVSIKADVALGPDGKMTPEAEAEFKARVAELEGSLSAHEKVLAEQEEALKKQTPEEQARQREAEVRREFENQLGNMIFSGSPAGGSWPESIGVGAAFEGDSIVVRAFLVADSEDKPPRPIPFMPILHAGPQISTEAANVLPADTDILVSASLDLAQMYDYVASMFKLFDLAAGAAGETDKQGLFDSQIGSYEKQLKFKIREDLINALGNEIAIALPAEMFGVRRASAIKQARGGAEKSDENATTVDIVDPSSPVVLIALKDKRAVQSLLPRALEALGVPGVSTEQLLQKQGEAELFTFAGGGVAFIDNFLVVAFDPRSMKRIVEAYNEGRTLGRSRHYRDPADWQPRQLIGQAYVSSALLREMFGVAHKSIEDIDDEHLRGYLSKLDPEPGAVTLAATRDAGGLTHEVHVPKNLLGLWTASTLVGQKLAAQRSNEAQAIGTLYNISHSQGEHKKSTGRYATLDELKSQTQQRYEKEGALPHVDLGSLFVIGGYDIKLTASGDGFEATATPTGYPKQGRRSFYIDQTGRLRGGDLGGRPANSSSDPIHN